MASDQTKIDIAYKKFSSREYTSTQKKWHEEFAGKALNLSSSDIWVDEIPVVPPATTTEVVEAVDLVLTEDVTVNNSLSWLCCSAIGDISTRLGDFIQPTRTRSQGYFVRLFDSQNVQIFVGDPCGWEFDYANGILTFENRPSNFTAPFRIKAYRYIGGVLDKDTFPSDLDRSYDGTTGNGSGRVIHADFGPVAINASNGSAALQISPVDYTPASGLADGQIINKAGILFVYDLTRDAWLSMMRQNVVFGAKKADGRFLSVGGVTAGPSGWPCLRDGRILGITAQGSSGYDAKRFSLMIGQTTVHDFSLSDYFYINPNLNIPFDAGSIIKVLASSEYTPCNNVTISLEVAWRA